MTGGHYHDKITRLRAPLITGPYNDSERDWPNAVSTPDLPANVQPLSSTEDVVAQQQTVTRWRVHTDPEPGWVATDRCEWDDGTPGGNTFEIDGDVEGHKRRGVPHHLEFVLKRVKQE